MHNRFGRSLGYDFEGYGAVQQQNGSNGWDAVWNSDFVRGIIPDKINFSIGGELGVLLAGGAYPINFTVLTRGKEPGIYLTPTFVVNSGMGAYVSGGISTSVGNYSGNPRDITSNMLTGETIGGVVSGGVLGYFSGNYSYAEIGSYGFHTFGIGVAFGAGGYAGAQYQNTPGVMSIWKW
ncbi:MAG TPA: hypothetical protein VLZ83_11435 [Edaphocola sp.]|nr:hypothetical protein [Edaphocola sp.]